jgi:D-alanyl-D-alanine carboxypeptidase/D-alanyl-D-alanine-endopeptidase (penicillin-binding protein 4)
MWKSALILLLVLTVYIGIWNSQIDGKSEIPNSLKELRENIDKILHNKILEKASVGIQIVFQDSGEVVYQSGMDQLLNPASNTKLITSAVALSVLKPEYTFKTAIYTDKSMSNGMIGNLYIKGFGDPDLSSQDLWVMAKNMINDGINTVEGDIIADDSFFDNQIIVKGWEHFTSPASVGISALSVNENTIKLFIRPGPKPGLPPFVMTDPPISYLRVTNRALTLATRGGITTYYNQEDGDGELVVTGRISKRSRGLYSQIQVREPALYTAAIFKEVLENLGVKIQGVVRKGMVPAKAQLLVLHQSKPLSVILNDSNKVSDNFVAEQILKTLGAEVKGAPGSTEKGIEVIREFLKEEIGIPPDSYFLENGSGLSRENRVSPAQIVKLLRYMYNNFEVKSEFLSSLAVAGVDGTMKRRLRDTAAERRLRVKTGALRDVSCLSGYALTRDNEVLTFSIMINGFNTGTYPIKQIQNQIGLLLTEFQQAAYAKRQGI